MFTTLIKKLNQTYIPPLNKITVEYISQRNIIRMYNHNFWGDNIEWVTPNKKIVGWLTPKPSKGDWIIAHMKSGNDGVFQIVKIESCNEVHDMFYAEVEPVAYEYEIKAFEDMKRDAKLKE